jgi:hypothetical protein
LDLNTVDFLRLIEYKFADKKLVDNFFFVLVNTVKFFLSRITELPYFAKLGEAFAALKLNRFSFARTGELGFFLLYRRAFSHTLFMSLYATSFTY